MINPSCLQSNVLRRIYKDSEYEVNRRTYERNSAKRAGNAEVAERLFLEIESYVQVARAALKELRERKEPLN